MARVDARGGPAQRQGRVEGIEYFKHIGLYVYRRDFLLGYSDLPVGPLEEAERLEQLRALENGHKIRVIENLTSHYVAMLGLYRFFYILNW